VPALALVLREEWHARREAALHWCPQLDLPAELQDVAIDGAGADGKLLPEWLNAFVASALRAYDAEADRVDSYADRVRPLRRGY
jgi:hypothetical protein